MYSCERRSPKKLDGPLTVHRHRVRAAGSPIGANVWAGSRVGHEPVKVSLERSPSPEERKRGEGGKKYVPKSVRWYMARAEQALSPTRHPAQTLPAEPTL